MNPSELLQRCSATAAQTGPLPLRRIMASGPDAQDFLQGQLTMDLRRLAVGAQQLTAWCSAKGRVWATVRAIRRDEGFELLVASELAESFIKRMRMFVLRAKVALQLDETVIYGLIQPGLASSPAGGALAIGKDHGLGFSAMPVASDAGAASRFKALLLLAGEPQIGLASQEKFLPQSLGLEELGGVHYNKGCYVGQEIVARVHYRGQPPQKLTLLIDPEEAQLDGKAILDEVFVEGVRLVQVVEYRNSDS